jgi:hypothetical protein
MSEAIRPLDATVGETTIAATPTNGGDVGLILKPNTLQHWKSPFRTYLTQREAATLVESLLAALDEMQRGERVR